MNERKGEHRHPMLTVFECTDMNGRRMGLVICNRQNDLHGPDRRLYAGRSETWRFEEGIWTGPERPDAFRMRLLVVDELTDTVRSLFDWQPLKPEEWTVALEADEPAAYRPSGNDPADYHLYRQAYPPGSQALGIRNDNGAPTVAWFHDRPETGDGTRCRGTAELLDRPRMVFERVGPEEIEDLPFACAAGAASRA